MTTYAEVLEAVRRLPVREQTTLIQEVRESLKRSEPLGSIDDAVDDDGWLPENFTEELTEAFFEAKQHALRRELPQ